MFTGIVLGKGEIARITPGADEARFTLRPLFPAPVWVKGESIAVNGACLSVETFVQGSFTAYASRETLRLTNLQFLRVGDKVNLERALCLGDRLGGHMVSGHVDGLATLASAGTAGLSRVLRVNFPEEFSPQVIPKGSVAIDGVSLTVNHCGPGFLEVNVIPDTQAVTTVPLWRVGQRLNFETDLIGKYVQRMLGARQSASLSPVEAPHAESPADRLSMDFLRENGF